MDPLERIKEMVTQQPVFIFMKGTPQFPQCGFSGRTVQALQACGEEFGFCNVYEDREAYENLPKYANWPTFPQVYINGELIGGCDIAIEMYQKGDLQKMIKEAVSKHKESQGA